MEEVVLLHVLRVLREWMGGVDQRLIQDVTMVAVGDELRHRLRHVFETGDCNLEFAAASGLVNDLQKAGERPHADIAPAPFYLPENSDSRYGMGRIFLRACSYRRRITSEQQPSNVASQHGSPAPSRPLCG